MGRFDDKVVLVTGAARGMGASHAAAFAVEGAHVVVSDVLEAPQKLRVELGERGLFLVHDVRSADAWTDVGMTVRDRYGRLDVLVNNAGVIRSGTVLESSEEDLRAVLDVNVVGTFHGIRAAAPLMREHGGAIVNVGSVLGLVGRRIRAVYCTSKFAVRGLTQAAAAELTPLGIRVNPDRS